MKCLLQLSVAVLLCATSGFADFPDGGTAPPQKNLKTYPLNNNPHSADISPDEQLVVTESTLRQRAADSTSERLAEIVQLWNFKENKLVAEVRLQETDVKPSAKGHFQDPIRGARVVRFSGDGKIIVALIEKTIYVLNAVDLTEIRTISPLSLMQNWRTRALELSPSGKVAAVLSSTDTIHGRIDLLDFSSGESLRSLDTPLGWVGSTKGMSWDRDGKLLLVPIPNEPPCLSPNSQPDVFAFDVDTEAIKKKFTTGLLAVSVAVLPGNRVLAVDGDCLGVLSNHDPKLRVFDLSTGKRIRQIAGRGTGVRYMVSASADGSRFLAFTGEVKVGFDWGDAVPVDKIVDQTFSVWNASDYTGVATSQEIDGLKASELRMSPKGGYAVSAGKASFVYELP